MKAIASILLLLAVTAPALAQQVLAEAILSAEYRSPPPLPTA